MSKPRAMVFLCDGKDCRRAWDRICRDESPACWLKRQLRESELPLKLDVVKTECMDRSEDAATICLMGGAAALVENRIDSKHDRERVVAAIHRCAERGGG